jgi:hypothetical protein
MVTTETSIQSSVWTDNNNSKYEAGHMTYRSSAILVATATLCLFATVQGAEAHHRRFFPFPHIFSQPAPDYGYDNYDEEYPIYEGDVAYADPYYVPRKHKRHRVIQGDANPWWLDEQQPRRLRNARTLEPKVYHKSRVKTAAAPVPKLAPEAVKRKVAPLALNTDEKPAAAKPAKPKLETASITPIKPKASKSIGCTAGAAIVTGYGFASVTPKTCIGSVYSYNAMRDGKSYLIKVTAAQGEITEVTRL